MGSAESKAAMLQPDDVKQEADAMLADPAGRAADEPGGEAAGSEAKGEPDGPPGEKPAEEAPKERAPSPVPPYDGADFGGESPPLGAAAAESRATILPAKAAAPRPPPPKGDQAEPEAKA